MRRLRSRKFKRLSFVLLGVAALLSIVLVSVGAVQLRTSQGYGGVEAGAYILLAVGLLGCVVVLALGLLRRALPSPRVFISYRRTDAGFVRGLQQALERDLGRDAVFFDLKSIPIGDPFPQRIRDALEASDACLVVIGPSWADDFQARQASASTDYVALEVSIALARLGARRRVLPVTFGEATMPSNDALPEELRPLTQFDGVHMTPSSKDYDDQVRRIVQWVNEA